MVPPKLRGISMSDCRGPNSPPTVRPLAIPLMMVLLATVSCSHGRGHYFIKWIFEKNQAVR